MSLERIVSKVEQDSKAAEQAILSEAAQYRNSQLAEAKRKRDAILAEFAAKAEQAIAQMRSREEAGLEMEVKKMSLASRKRILDTAFRSVLEHFSGLPQARKRKVYAALLAKASEDIPRGKIRHLKGEEPLFPASQAYARGENITGAGGFIVESADGHLEMDMRFEVLLKDLWDRNLAEVSAMLFGDGGRQ